MKNFFASVFLFILPIVVWAQGGTGGGGGGGGTEFGGGGGGTEFGGGLENPLNIDSFPELFDRIFKAAMVIFIPLAVLFIVYAGLRLILARGRPQELETAKKNLLYTFIGIAIFIMASVIIRVLINLACGVDIRGLDQCD